MRGPAANSVWYSYRGRRAARDLVLELDAAGDLDAVVDVFRRDRSQLSSLACGQTNRRGRLTLDFTQPRNATLLVRVAQRGELGQRRVHAARRRPGRARSARPARARRLGRVGQRRPDRQPRRRVRRHDVAPAAPTACTSSRASAASPRAVPARHVARSRTATPVRSLRLRRLLPLHARPRRGRPLQRPGAGAAQPPRRAALPPAGRPRRRGRHGARRSSSPTTSACAARCAGAGRTSSTSTGSTCGRPSILDLRLRTGSAARSTSSSSARAAAGSRAPAAAAARQQIRLRAEAGPLLHGGALALRRERPLHAVAPDAHDHQDARARRTAARDADVRPGQTR